MRLRVSDNKRFLLKDDGTAFFYLADTAWGLFHRLNQEEAEVYLTDRVVKGFTVIQAVVLAKLDGLKAPNPYGNLPLEDNDPAKPNGAYFSHIDWIVDKTESLGLYIGMLPTWGDKVGPVKWGRGPEIFTVENARSYGRFLGRRYRDKPIIWILGGDRNPEEERYLAIWRAMAAGIKEGDEGKNLMTYHPVGPSNSSSWFHHDDWLDFNMAQSGHAALNLANYEFTITNYHFTPPKPTLDGEPRYEDIPVGFKPENGRFGDFDVRQAAYWSLLAGACGHTYGNHNIWQMWQPGREPLAFASTPWRQALDHPGAFQMGYVRKLFESRPYQKLVPDQSLIADEQGTGGEHIRAARAIDGNFAFAYTPMGKPITVKLSKLSAEAFQAYWYDPRTGRATEIGKSIEVKAQQFTPPSGDPKDDWVLVIDDASKDYPAPGTVAL